MRVRVERAVVLPPDTTLCRGEALVVQPDYPDSRYVWSDGSRDSTLTVSQTGIYSVRIPSVNCSLADTIRVQVADCPGEVPNVFTPNGDGRNETFAIENIELSPWRLQVYNRWGKSVYQSEAYRNEWAGDGLSAGTYYYELRNETLNRSLKGWVQLLR